MGTDVLRRGARAPEMRENIDLSAVFNIMEMQEKTKKIAAGASCGPAREDGRIMERIARFEKVSRERFLTDFKNSFGLNAMPEAAERLVEALYEAVGTPKRATTGSAGYDFYAPCDLTLEPGDTIRVPTGIRAKIAEGWVLLIMPRSGLGFKYRLQLDNTVGVIDSDYYDSDNEGHILIKITNCSLEGKTLMIPAGSGFAQGVFLPFGITEDDAVTDLRNGGLGSTTK